MRRCNDCVYWRRNDKTCHANPPTVLPSMGGAIAVWPSTDGGDFCGSFEPNNESMLRQTQQDPPQIRGGRITRPVDPVMRPSEREGEMVVDA